jgi:hypothetical protein
VLVQVGRDWAGIFGKTMERVEGASVSGVESSHCLDAVLLRRKRRPGARLADALGKTLRGRTDAARWAG